MLQNGTILFFVATVTIKSHEIKLLFQFLNPQHLILIQYSKIL